METNHHAPLTSSEISVLWGFYTKNSLALCMMRYFLEKVEDPDIREVIQLALNHQQKDLSVAEEVYHSEQMAIPVGFTDEDVQPSAPRLFSDAFMLEYVRQLAVVSIATSGAAIPFVTRSDVTKVCHTVLQQGTELHEKAKETLLSKGLYNRPPSIPAPNHVDFVEKQSFLAGFLRERRPLSAVEISHIFMNAQTNGMGKALMMGFAQAAKDTKVKKFFVRGKEIAHKHMEIFHSLLVEEDLPSPKSWEDQITDSTVSPFSDKLMTFHTTTLIDSGIGNYGLATAASPRRDLGADYGRLMLEVAQMAKDGANLMIDNGWLEQPPPSPDREELEKP
ncbi:hypothetical protein HNR44_002718 [Geomicrobium halophilum]|uniref:DUF3231 family protein n=1 Tax=Geomicrobium halophilum TaxID=549000 RepID=A0A841Q2K2_9BACL|nr:DUF3231 family protein [Geomicrobium halophilum]MBB6450728.1 hypothetical protein [Geomicrobium halophilum]